MKKFKKVVLSLKTLGLIKDRLDRILNGGIFNVQGAWTENTNPDHKNIDWNYCLNTVYLPQKSTKKVILEKTCLLITSSHRSMLNIALEFGDTFFFKNNSKIIYIKSHWKHPMTKKGTHLRKITLIGDQSNKLGQTMYQASERRLRESDEEYDRYFEQVEKEMFEELEKDYI